MKLPFPTHLATTPCRVLLSKEGLDEEGAPIQSLDWEGNCIYSEKGRTTVDAEKRIIRLEGKVVIEGDIAPALTTLTDGSVEIAGKTYSVYKSQRPRNPDGTVHHTTLELI